MQISPLVRPSPLVAAVCATVFAVFFAGTLAAAAVVRAPPARLAGVASSKEVITRRLLSDSAPRRVIALAAPSAAESAGMKAANALRVTTSGNRRSDTGKGRPLTIGFGRELPSGAGELQGAALPWQAVADGGYAARIDVSSPGAVAIRVALAVTAADPGVTIRFAGSDTAAPVFGPIPVGEVADATEKFGVYWSPVLDGSTATLEIHAPAGTARDRIVASLVRVSHLAITGAALNPAAAKRVTEIGQAASCEIDIVCVTPPTQALRDAADSVAQIVFTLDDGRTGLCTATMLNNTAGNFQPYLYAASHCVDRQSVASTVNTYWFFDAVACGSLQVPPYVVVPTGLCCA
jgi:lysyl endopeptidase